MSNDSNRQPDPNELLSHYDPESRYRQLGGSAGWLIGAWLVAFSLYQLYVSIYPAPPAQQNLAIHLAFGLGAIYLLYPGTKKANRRKLAATDVALAVIAVGGATYWVYNFDALINRIGNFTTLDYVNGGIVILLVLEAARRVVGIPIVAIASLFLLYALFGNYLGGFLEHRGYIV